MRRAVQNKIDPFMQTDYRMLDLADSKHHRLVPLVQLVRELRMNSTEGRPLACCRRK
jgi:hypothetical protein